VWKLAVSHGVTVPVKSWLPNDTSDQYAAMLPAPEKTTALTAACVNGCDGATAGGVGWKLSRMTRSEEVVAAAMASGACVTAAIESGVIVVPLLVPVTTTRIPGFMSVGAMGISSSLLWPSSWSTVHTNRLVPPSKLSA